MSSTSPTKAISNRRVVLSSPLGWRAGSTGGWGPARRGSQTQPCEGGDVRVH